MILDAGLARARYTTPVSEEVEVFGVQQEEPVQRKTCESGDMHQCR